MLPLPQFPWYGDTELEVHFPDWWEVIVPRMAGENSPKLSGQQIQEALRNPIGTPRLASLASGRKEAPFITINVAGLDDNMFADTLFGHRKGAFTGADHVRSGLIEKASGGTLFLDEIGDLSIASQVKLLRLLEANEYFPLGSDIFFATSLQPPGSR